MAAPLSRNRNYQLLWGSQALAEFGAQASTIAFPLLVLSLTGSASATGLVLGTSAAAALAAGLPAGALVDRWNRKKVMLGSEAAQVIAATTLVVALVVGSASVAHIVLVAAVMGVCSALFEPAENACLPGLMSAEQVPTAVALNAARGHLGQLSGTAAGGFLFAVGRFAPFAVNVLTHGVSLFLLMFIRLPAPPERREPVGRLDQEIAAGFRWMWRHRPVRVIGLFAVVLNLFFAAYFVIIIVVAQKRGVPSGEIGIMAAMFGVGGILGALAAPYLQRRVTPYVSIVAVFWALTALTPVAIFISNAYLLGALFAGMAFLVPTADTTIDTYQLLLTPDEMRGRMTAVMGVLIGIAGVVGPVLGGVLMDLFAANLAVLLCSAGIGMITLYATINPTLRKFPRHVTAVPPPDAVR